MKELIGLGAGALGAAAVSMALFGTGVAAADDYAGKSYSDASSALSDASLKGVIASRVGDAVAEGDCVVTRSQMAPWIKGDSFSPVTDTVLLYLNCNAKVATAGTPGNSLASPEGRAERATEDEAAAQAAAQQNQADELLGTGGAPGAPGSHG
jgi:hypothetical protein